MTRLVQKERALFSRTDIRGSLLTEKSAPSPILRPEKGPFLLALGSPFGLALSAALAPIRGSLRESWGGLLTLPHRFGKRIPPESKPCQERGRKKFQRFKAAHVRTLCGGPARRPLFLDIAPFRVVQLKPATGRCGGMVDTRDLKSLAGDRVPVRVRSPAPRRSSLRTARKRQARKRLPFPHLCSVAPPSQIGPAALGSDLDIRKRAPNRVPAF